MVVHRLCEACRQGDHSKHHKVIQGAPNGMMGGVQCPCEGDCKDKFHQAIADEAMRFGGNK